MMVQFGQQSGPLIMVAGAADFDLEIGAYLLVGQIHFQIVGGQFVDLWVLADILQHHLMTQQGVVIAVEHTVFAA